MLKYILKFKCEKSVTFAKKKKNKNKRCRNNQTMKNFMSMIIVILFMAVKRS